MSDLHHTVDHLATRLEEEHRRLALLWLERLDALLSIQRNEVFPTHQLLDHIPTLVLEIAAHLRQPDEPIAANTAVMAKAEELGLLRFDQRASVHQLLREYQIFAEILEDFCADEAAKLGTRADAGAALRAVSRASKAVRVLEQKTVDAFITRYMETIENKTAQLRSFSRLISHEIRQPLGVLQVLSRVITVPEGDQETAALVQSLERNVVRLGEVATKLERLTRLTRRPEGLPHEDVIDFTRLAADVVEQLQAMADARGVTIEIGDQLPSLVTDAGRAELVLVNLIANAIKYSDPGKTARRVRIEGEHDADHRDAGHSRQRARPARVEAAGDLRSVRARARAAGRRAGRARHGTGPLDRARGDGSDARHDRGAVGGGRRHHVHPRVAGGGSSARAV